MTTIDVLQAALDLGYVYVWCGSDRLVLSHPALERPRPGETSMERRRQQGRCMRCGDPADGKSLCPAHLEAGRQYQARYDTKRREEAHGRER